MMYVSVIIPVFNTEQYLRCCLESILSQVYKDFEVLLIDDVMTTGATVNECTKVLLKAGAKSVDILTLARVIKD